MIPCMTPGSSLQCWRAMRPRWRCTLDGKRCTLDGKSCTRVGKRCTRVSKRCAQVSKRCTLDGKSCTLGGSPSLWQRDTDNGREGVRGQPCVPHRGCHAWQLPYKPHRGCHAWQLPPWRLGFKPLSSGSLPRAHQP